MSPTTTLSAPTATRLPGIHFDAVPPAPDAVLPRMDIAGFVGFAASGPVGVPVAVEDAAQFANVFGADAPLAWDRAHGEQAYALLGPAVRAFFRNGGRRCWVVRVAEVEHATHDSFELPGVAAVDQRGEVGFATLRARSYGSWADGLTVSSALESSALELEGISVAQPSLRVRTTPRPALVAGDLVRVSFPRQSLALYLILAELTPTPTSPPARADASQTTEVSSGAYAWVSPAQPLPGTAFEISFLGSDGSPRSATATVADVSPAEELITLAFEHAFPQAPLPGALMLATSAGAADGSASLIFEIASSEATPEGITAVAGTALQVAAAPQSLPPSGADCFAERLTLRLTVGGTGGAPIVLGGLGFAPAHPRFLGALPNDEGYYAVAGDASQPRFPLGGADHPPAWYLPLGATIVPSRSLGALYPPISARQRDGLGAFSSRLFIDPALAGERTTTLMASAEFIRDQSPNARALEGMHALLGADEVTLIAVPDAVQRGWIPESATGAAAPLPSAPVARPDFSRFLPCSTVVPVAPQFTASSPPEAAGGVLHLTWTATDVANAVYQLERAGNPAFASAGQLYLGPEREFALGRPPEGSNVYLRVRALAGGAASDWSAGLLVELPSSERWYVNSPQPTPSGVGLPPEPGYSPTALLEVHAAALRMCAARGDMLAVLALPEHYRGPDAIAHVQALRAAGDLAPGSTVDPIFSFGALYHPWLFGSDPEDPTSFRRISPDGAAAGVIAARTLASGAWVAPANEPLQDVLALDEPLGEDVYKRLAEAQINIVRQDSGGFLSLAADTLAEDPDLRDIGVRRLLAVLRRTAIRYGDAHAFEPNSEITRRTARRSFEALLGQMFSLGAFAGARTDQAFQVSTPATQNDLDGGRLVVELRVAPSRPLEFLTVRLVRAGAGSLQIESR